MPNYNCYNIKQQFMRIIFMLAAITIMMSSCNDGNNLNQGSRNRRDSVKNSTPNEKIQLKATPEDSAAMTKDSIIKH